MNLNYAASLLFTPDEVLIRGFETIKGLPVITEDDFTESNIRLFKGHFGPSPTTVAFVWNDIMTTNCTELGILSSEKSEKGFKRFLIGIYFLWAYPKNAMILSSTTGICERMVRGENLWHWPKAIGRLKYQVISWPEDDYNNPQRNILLTVDGIDFKTYKKSNDDYNFDPKQFSHKCNDII